MFIPPCILVTDSHPYGITCTKCRINTVVSPDYRPIGDRNMWSLINISILRKVVHQVGFIYKIIQRCTATKHKKKYTSIYYSGGPGSSIGIATAYELDGSGIEFRWGQDFPHLSRPGLRPTQPPVQWVPSLSRG
jgi:hypothetical protein